MRLLINSASVIEATAQLRLHFKQECLAHIAQFLRLLPYAVRICADCPLPLHTDLLMLTIGVCVCVCLCLYGQTLSLLSCESCRVLF